MKRLLILALLLTALPLSTMAGYIGEKSGRQVVTVRDSLVAADTVAQAIRVDTGTTEEVSLVHYGALQLMIQLAQDTNFANDTARIYLQVSPDLGGSTRNWTTIGPIAKITAAGNTFASAVYQLDTLNYLPDYMRLLCIPRDSCESAAAFNGLNNNAYTNTFTVWIKRWR